VSFVRTVLGDIPAESLGVCDAHEHVIIDPCLMTRLNPDLAIDSVENACRELAEFRAAGGGAMIDALPCDTGRSVAKLAEISRRTGVHIVASTGLHLMKYYASDHWRYRRTVQEMADLFVAEIEDGIDGDPRRRAGVIKAASGIDWDHEQVVFRAAVEAHRRTGAPILTHTEPYGGLQQVRFLTELRVDPRRIVVSHADREPDEAYHLEMLKAGVNLEYDRLFRWKAGERRATFDLLARFIGEFPDQLMLGGDAARASYWRSYGGGPGLAALLREARGSGLDEAALHRVFVATPARAYSILK
jgi:phosphotriesterase-related protein